MEWLEILKIHKGLEFFFDVSVPAAIEKNECFGHVLLVCGDAVIRRHFAEELINLLQPLAVESSYKKTSEDVVAAERSVPAINYRAVSPDRDTKVGDVAAILTNLNERDVWLFDRGSFELSDECLDVLGPAMDTFELDVILGKGTSAKSIRLDLPEFTFVACVAQETEEIKRLESHFAYVIKIEKAELAELCEKTAVMKAQEEGYSLADDAFEYLARCAACDCMAVENYTARVIEYMKRYHAIGTQITYEHAEDVLCKLGIRPEIAANKAEQENDLQLLLKDIRKQIGDLRRDVSQVKMTLEELKGDGAKYSMSEIGEKLDYIEELVESIG